MNRLRFLSNVTGHLSAIFLLALFLVSFGTTHVSAISQADLKQIYTPFYDEDSVDCGDPSATIGASSVGGSSGNFTYTKAGNIPAEGKEVGATLFGGHFVGGAWKPTNDVQNPSGKGNGNDDNGVGNSPLGIVGRTGYAELSISANSRDYSALGKLPQQTKLEIIYNGKSIIAEKLDVGAGGAPINGKPRAIDIWWETARLLNMTDSSVVTIRAVDPSTPLTPLNGKALTAGVSNTPTTATAATTTAGGNIYVLGDSLTVGLKSSGSLEQNLKTAKYTPRVNGQGSRPLYYKNGSSGGISDGFTALNSDKDFVKSAGTVVIGLGTNKQSSDAEFRDKVGVMIDTVRGLNPAARILWTNVTGGGNKDTYQSYNTILNDLSKSKNFEIVDWASIGKQYLNNDVHPSAAGYQALANKIVEKLVSSPAGLNNVGSGDETPEESCCEVSASGDSSAPNIPTSADLEARQKAVYDFFVSKVAEGYKPWHAAGIIGNMMAESSVEPQRLQGTRSGVKTSAEAARGSSQGWGLVQFTPAGKFINAVQPISKANEMGTQLQFLFDQLEGRTSSPEKNAGKELKATTNVEEAVKAFQGTKKAGGQYAGYERPKDQSGSIPHRTAAAKAVLAKFGSGSGPISATVSDSSGGCAGSTDGSTSTPGNATIVGDNAFPLAPTKSVVTNPGMFKNNTASKGGHPYTAYDILTPPRTTVVAFLSGTVTKIGQDRCPGRLISVYNQPSNLVISYLHLDFGDHVAVGTVLKAGDRIGKIGPAQNGCGIAHLHIDAVKGKVRIGCSRLNCPPSNAAQFVDIGPQLFTTFQAMPK